VKILKSKGMFFIGLILSAIILLISLYFIKGILPTHAKSFTAEIISVFALAIAIGSPLYKNLFPKKLLRKYHVSAQDLTALYGRHGDERDESDVHDGRCRPARVDEALCGSDGLRSDLQGCCDESTIPLRGRRKGRTWMF
jgi:hypothetical protein